MTFDPSTLLRSSPPGPERMWLVQVMVTTPTGDAPTTVSVMAPSEADAMLRGARRVQARGGIVEAISAEEDVT